MQLVENNQGWHIEGVGSERACVADAAEENGRLVLSLRDSRGHGSARAPKRRARHGRR
jgi:hypothetical protein